MKYNLLAGLALGLIAAVVFASATTGPLLARLALFFVTPLPLALAGLGWGWLTGLVAGTSGIALVLLIGGPVSAVAYAVTQVAPMVTLLYLASLSRPVPLPPAYAGAGAGETTPREWYPAGRLIVWTAALGALLAILTLVLIGDDIATLERNLSDGIEAMIKGSLPEGDAAPADPERVKALARLAMDILPAALAMSWMTCLLFNLWLGGRVTFASGQLERPWPDLAAITFPRGTGLAFAAVLFATAIAGYPGIAATSFAGGLFVAYVLMGLAILHYTTRERPWRPFALFALYGGLLVANAWVAAPVAILGLLDSFLHIRARFAAPPASPT